MSLEEVKARNVHHKAHKAGWLRAAVLGSNDGLVATASLMIGVAAATSKANSNQSFLITAGLAGIIAGAMSMAVGEYISVSSQTDIENADRQMEIEHLAMDPEGELEELTQIYMERGLDRELAAQVAKKMTEKDALGAHLRDELGQIEHTKANPLQAAIASATRPAVPRASRSSVWPETRMWRAARRGARAARCSPRTARRRAWPRGCRTPPSGRRPGSRRPRPAASRHPSPGR